MTDDMKNSIWRDEDPLSPAKLETYKDLMDRNIALHVSDTANREIENVQAHEKALQAHYDLWREERRKLGQSAYAAPSFELGMKEQRNLQAEYQDLRAAWTTKREQIDQHYLQELQHIRNDGQTLSREFSEANSVERSALSSTEPQALSHSFNTSADVQSHSDQPTKDTLGAHEQSALLVTVDVHRSVSRKR